MKKLSLKSLTFALALSMVIILLVLPSCRSLDVAHSDVHQSSLIAHTSHHDTVVIRDSVFVSERQKGDTVYLTRTEWRDRWRTRVERDTVVDVRVEKEVVQLPPERYVPKFYKWCTVLLFALLTVVFARWWLKRRI